VKLLSKLSKNFDNLLNFLTFLSCTLVCFVTVIICFDVVSRQFWNKPIIWVTEISEYSLLWITFLGAAWLLREEGHIRIDLLPKLMNQKHVHLLDTLNSFLGALICLVIGWYSAVVVWDFYVRDERSIEMLGTPRYIILIVIPITCFLLLIQFLRRAYGHLSQWRIGENS
jgi:TRAP-type C4-dicarboxylate transport system permease small subunit